MRHSSSWNVVVVAGVAGLASLAMACASNDPTATTTPTSTSTGNPDAPIKLDPPPDGYQITFGPFAVPSGDVQLCRTLKLDNEEPVAINRLDLKMLAGSHHFILFRAQHTRNPDGTLNDGYIEYPDQVFDCKGTINFDEWDFVYDVNKVGGMDFQMKAGQAIILPPRAQLMVQAHFLNASAVKAPQGGYDVLNMYKTKMADVIHPLRGQFTVDTHIAIPPKADNWFTQRRCSFSRSVHVVAMTGHFHHQGRTFNVYHQNMFDNTMISQAYCSGPDCTDPEGQAGNWDHPVFKYFDPPLIVNGGIDGSFEGFRFSCTYDNPTDRTIYFGGLAETQEHCNLFFQYYYDEENKPGAPIADPLSCAEGSGGW